MTSMRDHALDKCNASVDLLLAFRPSCCQEAFKSQHPSDLCQMQMALLPEGCLHTSAADKVAVLATDQLYNHHIQLHIYFNCRVPEECPAAMDALWKRCVAVDPAQRPTAEMIMAEIQTAVEQSVKR